MVARESCALAASSETVYACYDRDDSWHAAMRKTIDDEARPLALPAVVIPEVDHLLGARIGPHAQLALYDDLAEGFYLVIDLDTARYRRVLEFNQRYADLRLGFVNTAVAALSEQLGVRRLATADRRHFPAISQEVPLELLPASP